MQKKTLHSLWCQKPFILNDVKFSVASDVTTTAKQKNKTESTNLCKIYHLNSKKEKKIFFFTAVLSSYYYIFLLQTHRKAEQKTKVKRKKKTAENEDLLKERKKDIETKMQQFCIFVICQSFLKFLFLFEVFFFVNTE